MCARLFCIHCLCVGCTDENDSGGSKFAIRGVWFSKSSQEALTRCPFRHDADPESRLILVRQPGLVGKVDEIAGMYR
jgi:hypothetical protein